VTNGRNNFKEKENTENVVKTTTTSIPSDLTCFETPATRFAHLIST
jgi:hypothetical protein